MKKIWILCSLIFIVAIVISGVNTPAFHTTCGVLYSKQGKFDKAIRDYNKAIKINPNYALAMRNIGNAYQEKGDKRQAKYWWNEALKKKEFLPDTSVVQIKKWLKELEK